MTMFPPLYRKTTDGNDHVVVAKGWCVIKPNRQELKTKKASQKMVHVEIKKEPEEVHDDRFDSNLMEIDEAISGGSKGGTMASK